MYDGLKKLEVPRRKHAGARRALKVSGIGVLIFALGVCGFGVYAYQYINHKIKKSQHHYAEIDPIFPDQPINALIVGSDRRSVVGEEDRNARQFRGGSGARTDTIMLLHVAAKADHGVLVSFPRDLLVRIPEHGSNRINASYAFGGPDLLQKTVKQLTGLKLQHYFEINFASFRSIVNAVGGVSIYFPKPVSDARSGLNITTSGCVTLDGDMALSFVRARHIYATADIGRIQAQQRFIRAVVAKAKSLGVIANPQKILKLANAIGAGLVIDDQTNLGTALGIARKLSEQSKLDFRIFPGSTRAGSPYVYPNYPQARQFFAALKSDLPLPDFGKTEQSLPTWSDVHVKVLNASGRVGWAKTQESKLTALGAHVPVIGTATKRRARTLITYKAGDQLKASLLLTKYPYAEVKPAPGAQIQDVVLTLGVDSLPVRASPGAASPSSAQPKPPAPKQSVLGQSCG